MKEIIINRLYALKNENFKKFNQALIPNIDINRFIGVYTKDLKDLAKELYHNKEFSIDPFLNDLPHYYFEENQLHIFIINLEKDYEKCLNEINNFLPFIDNWATCDQLNPSVFKKHLKELLPTVLIWLKSNHPYTVRFAIKTLKCFYLNDEYKDLSIDIVSKIKSNEYYINMMIAWFFQEALLKQYDTAIIYLKNNSLSSFVQNKAIQKCCESFRITIEKKTYLKTLKVSK